MWMDDLFGVKKPIIALLHLRALPGDPGFDGDLNQVIRQAREDLLALQEGGVDGVLIANEFSLPYQPKPDYVTLGAMGYLVGRLNADIRVPFGVNVVMNALATLDLAAATGADFIRSTFTGAYMGEQGIFTTDAAACARRKKALGLNHLRLLYKVNPESEVYLAERDIKAVTRSIIFHCNPDGLCVSGANAGMETSTRLLAQVKSAAEDVPVFCNTGLTLETAREKLAEADGACVGTAFKAEGKFKNPVDLARVIHIMDIVKQIRKESSAS